MLILKRLKSMATFNTHVQYKYVNKYISGCAVDFASLCLSYVIVPHELISYKPSLVVKLSIMCECLRERNAAK